mmetsp:Transcript_5902/g.10605  ORF Transcript_5902/g.10605 Transcript_5902/m.10605 type:complete len:225 (+) Transcript_5902:259-933(+)
METMAFIPSASLGSGHALHQNVRTVPNRFVTNRWVVGSRLLQQCSRRTTQGSKSSTQISMVWLDQKTSQIVEAPRDMVFDLFSNLEDMPQWSPWLASVKIDAVDPSVSTWKLAARGIEVEWKARNVDVKKDELIAWESLDGLKNRGQVKFETSSDGKDHTKITMQVSFDMPSWIAAALRNDVVDSIVQSTLKKDLERFREIALRKLRKKRMMEKSQKTPVEFEI